MLSFFQVISGLEPFTALNVFSPPAGIITYVIIFVQEHLLPEKLRPKNVIFVQNLKKLR